MIPRQQQIRRAILRSLQQTGSYLVPEAALKAQVDLLVSPPTLQSEFSAALKDLDESAYLIGVRPDAFLGGDARWKLSITGQAAAAELN